MGWQDASEIYLPHFPRSSCLGTPTSGWDCSNGGKINPKVALGIYFSVLDYFGVAGWRSGLWLDASSGAL